MFLLKGDLKELGGSLNPNNIFELMEYRRVFKKEHPDYFYPDGILVFCGPQGSGKTLSAVQYVRRLCAKYPKAIVCTNMDLEVSAETRVVRWMGVDTFNRLKNGENGVIYLLDEIHLEFNSLESKRMDVSIFKTVSQQRKQRIHIVGTSQLFMRIAKPFREQFKYCVMCRNLFGSLQINTVIDGTTAKEDNGKLIASSLGTSIWFHTPRLYGTYDTFAVIKRFTHEGGEL